MFATVNAGPVAATETGASGGLGGGGGQRDALETTVADLRAENGQLAAHLVRHTLA